MTETGGSSWSRSCSKGASSLVVTASMKPGKSLARTSSEGMMLGSVRKRMLFGLGSEPMKPSHSSVTTNVMRMLSGFLEASCLQRFIMGLTWPLPGYGTATTWQTLVGFSFAGSMLREIVWHVQVEGSGSEPK